jgi:hypothetical protein
MRSQASSAFGLVQSDFWTVFYHVLALANIVQRTYLIETQRRGHQAGRSDRVIDW